MPHLLTHSPPVGSHSPRRSRQWGIGRLSVSVLGFAAALTAVTLLPGCVDRPTPQEEVSYNDAPAPATSPSATTGPGPATTPADLNQFVGQTLAISGQVGEVYGTSAFLLQPGPNAAASKGVLVLVPTPNTLTLPAKGDFVQLNGQVREFETATLEQEYDFAWDDQTRQNLVAQFQSQPVVIAQVQ